MDLKSVIRRTAQSDIETIAPDAVVVGAGASGGLAAQILCEAGLKVLVLDAGLPQSIWPRPLDWAICKTVRGVSRPSATRYIHPKVLWKAKRALQIAGGLRRPVQSACYAWPTSPDGFVDDIDNPYETPDDKPYRWIRARQLGGRMAVPAHGKQYYRHAARDFAPEDSLSPDWPFEPSSLDRWYEDVEKRIAMHGRREGISWIPDSEITHMITPNETQQKIMSCVKNKWPETPVMLGRYAPPPNSLQAAALTGRLYIRQGAIAAAILTNERNRVSGVNFHDGQSRRNITIKAPLVFLCASAFESVRILLNSKSDRSPKGLGGKSGHLGRHIMDHVSVKAEGQIKGADFGTTPLRPEDCVFLPRFDMRDPGTPGTGRGYGVRLYVYPGPGEISHFTAVSDSEMHPRPENHVTLSDKKDRWGIPSLRISCEHSALEVETAAAQETALREISEAFGATLLGAPPGRSVPGSSIHEVGGARMGADPDTSVLDANNQCWDAKGLYVTDGAAFPSIGVQNPTLTIMALTARACSHALAQTDKANEAAA